MVTTAFSEAIEKTKVCETVKDLTGIFYAQLVIYAKQKTVVHNALLLAELQRKYPQFKTLQMLMPSNVNGILRSIAEFATQNSLPNLATLVVAKNGKCTPYMRRHFSCTREKLNCFSFNWAGTKSPVFHSPTSIENTAIKRPSAIRVVAPVISIPVHPFANPFSTYSNSTSFNTLRHRILKVNQLPVHR